MKHKKQLRRKDAAATSNGQGKFDYEQLSKKAILRTSKVKRKFRRRQILGKFNSIKCFFMYRCSRLAVQHQRTTIAIRQVVVFRFQAQQRRKFIKIKFKLSSAKLLNQLNFNEKFQQWKWKGLDERAFRRWKRRWHRRRWNALLKLN